MDVNALTHLRLTYFRLKAMDVAADLKAGRVESALETLTAALETVAPEKDGEALAKAVAIMDDHLYEIADAKFKAM